MKFWPNFPLKKRSLQYTSALICLLTSVSSGIHAGWASPYLPYLLRKESTIPMTNNEASWVVIIYLAGGPFGALITCTLLDVIGRKVILLLSSFPFLISCILIGLATTLPELLIARFLAGFSDGLVFGVTPIYIGEICDPEIRGFLGCSITITFLIGVLFANITGSYLQIQSSAMLYATVPVIFFVMFIWMPESPNFFLIKGDNEKARNSMVAFKGPLKADQSLELVGKAIEEEKLGSTPFISLFKKTNKRSLLIMMGLRLTQQFSGVVAFTFYAQTVFQEAGDSISPLLAVIIFYSVQIVCSIISSIFIDKVGRKPLLIISTVGASICLVIEGLFFLIRDVIKLETGSASWLPTVVLFAFKISFSVGLQSVPLFLGAEIFSNNVKAYAAFFSDVYYFVLAMLASKYFQFAKDEYGMYVPFLTFAVCCASGLIIIVYFVPETKNKTLEEIQIELKNI